jgi:hypothetical protein
MNEHPDDDNFDLLLRQHFKATLDGQLGRAPDVLARTIARRRPWRTMILTSAGTALAASIALVALLKPTPRGLDDDEPMQHAIETHGPIEYEIAWKTFDEGMLYLGEGTPVHGLRRQRVDSLRWIDPSTKATVEVTVPRDEIMLVGLNAS